MHSQRTLGVNGILTTPPRSHGSTEVRSTPEFHGILAPSSVINMSEDRLSPNGDAKRDLLRSIVETRKKWKISGGEAVWSLKLEAALLEGLAQYQPTVCKETVLLGRFPRRNQFISEYIWRKTGQRRTAKQIGSRLQQLRVSSQGHELTHLLFPSPKSITSSLSANSHAPHAENRIAICIDILPAGVPEAPCDAPPRPWTESQNNIHISHYPRRLACIDPTVAFLSRSPLLAQSQFIVWTDHAVHTVTTGPLTVTPSLDTPIPDPPYFLYRAALVPGYWNTILESPDPTCFTIFHNVVKVDDSTVVFSAMYYFRYQYSTGSADSTSSGRTTYSNFAFDPTQYTRGGA
ncbi:hypothetical protein DFH09DRAFT_1153524 [Mycena vulgaris]|nr:hypothetical protein DFH09DRAFT_1153524 [Mycena vulgaris]